jgi:3-oxoadipate enol-lactonase
VRHADDLASLLDTLGIGRVALVSSRDGDEIALELALDQPGRVRALVLAHPRIHRQQPPARDDGAPIAVRSQEIFTPAETRALSKAIWRRFVIRMQNVVLQHLRAWPHRWRDRYYPTSWAEIRVIDRLAEVHAPTLIVRGELAGPISREIAEQLRAAIPLSEVASVPGASMEAPLAAPAAFNRIVLDFLAAHYRPDAPERDATS